LLTGRDAVAPESPNLRRLFLLDSGFFFLGAWLNLMVTESPLKSLFAQGWGIFFGKSRAGSQNSI